MPEIGAVPQITEPVSIEADNREIIMPQKSASEPVAVQPKIIVTPISWQGVVFVIWAGVAIVMVLLLLQRVVFVCGLVAQAKEASPLMNDTLKYCCGTIGLKVSANTTSPAVCGLFRPVILVPENLGASLGVEHLRTVLLHELAHIKRGDLWVNLVQTLLQIVYFYNPLLWLANAMIRRVWEQAVDEAAEIFKSAVTKEQWENSVKTVRIPLGKVISREAKSEVYTKQLPGAPDGEYVVIEFNTSFENKKEAVETITPMKDKDEVWRVSGYYIK